MHFIKKLRKKKRRPFKRHLTEGGAQMKIFNNIVTAAQKSNGESASDSPLIQKERWR